MYDSRVGSKIKSLTTPRQTFVSRRGGDQIGGCDQLRHAISLDRPRIAPPILPVVGRKIKGNGGGGGERRGEKSAAKRHRSLLYTPLRVFFARVCACEISSWSRSGCFHGESALRRRDRQRNWTRRVRAAMLEKFRSRHSRSYLLLWEEAKGQGKGRGRER